MSNYDQSKKDCENSNEKIMTDVSKNDNSEKRQRTVSVTSMEKKKDQGK